MACCRREVALIVTRQSVLDRSARTCCWKVTAIALPLPSSCPIWNRLWSPSQCWLPAAFDLPLDSVSFLPRSWPCWSLHLAAKSLAAIPQTGESRLPADSQQPKIVDPLSPCEPRATLQVSYFVTCQQAWAFRFSPSVLRYSPAVADWPMVASSRRMRPWGRSNL